MKLWALIIGMGAVTYLLRLSGIALFGRMEIPPMLRQALRFIPPAVLSALVTPALLRPAGALEISLENQRLLAGLLAALVAYRTRNTLLTIGLGMAALWVLQWLTR